MHQETRCDIGTRAPDLAQGFETALLFFIAARLLGHAEQGLFVLVQCVPQRALQLAGQVCEHALQHRARAWREGTVLEGRRRFFGYSTERWTGTLDVHDFPWRSAAIL